VLLSIYPTIQLITTILLLCPLVGLTQNDKFLIFQNTKNKIYWGVYYSPEYANVISKGEHNPDLEKNIRRLNKENPIAKYGDTKGIYVGQEVNERWSIEIGLSHSSRGYQTPKEVFDYDPLIYDSGYFYSLVNDITHFRTEHNYRYIGIPIGLNYRSTKGRFKFIASMGVTPEMRLDSELTLFQYFEDGRILSRNIGLSSRSNLFNLTPYLGSGIEYQLFPKILIRAVPTVRWGASAVVKHTTIEHLYNAGLQFGISIIQ